MSFLVESKVTASKDLNKISAIKRKLQTSYFMALRFYLIIRFNSKCFGDTKLSPVFSGAPVEISKMIYFWKLLSK